MKYRMIRPSVYPQRLMPSPTFSLDYSEGDLAVLPPLTKVVVTGNNRTRSVLVGLQGVVKKSVGLGGWHWLVLTNGVEVKLQRNALSVIEAPTREQENQSKSLISAPHLQFNTRPQRKLTVDMGKLGAVSLWRYWRHYKLDGKNVPSSKAQLIEAVERHFVSQKLDEFQVIADFLHAAKRLRQSVHGHPHHGP